MVGWSVLLSGQVVNLDSAPFKKNLLRVGREDDSDLVIPSNGVSREHAEIKRLKTNVPGSYEYFVRDLESSNGTWIKKEKHNERGIREISWQELHPSTAYKLESGTTMRFGDIEVTLTFREDLVQTGQMYLSDVLREQLESYQNEEEEETGKEQVIEEKKFLHTIIDAISKHNPFKK